MSPADEIAAVAKANGATAKAVRNWPLWKYLEAQARLSDDMVLQGPTIAELIDMGVLLPPPGRMTILSTPRAPSVDGFAKLFRHRDSFAGITVVESSALPSGGWAMIHRGQVIATGSIESLRSKPAPRAGDHGGDA